MNTKSVECTCECDLEGEPTTTREIRDRRARRQYRQTLATLTQQQQTPLDTCSDLVRVQAQEGQQDFLPRWGWLLGGFSGARWGPLPVGSGRRSRIRKQEVRDVTGTCHGSSRRTMTHQTMAQTLPITSPIETNCTMVHQQTTTTSSTLPPPLLIIENHRISGVCNRRTRGEVAHKIVR